MAHRDINSVLIRANETIIFLGRRVYNFIVSKARGVNEIKIITRGKCGDPLPRASGLVATATAMSSLELSYIIKTLVNTSHSGINRVVRTKLIAIGSLIYSGLAGRIARNSAISIHSGKGFVVVSAGNGAEGSGVVLRFGGCF